MNYLTPAGELAYWLVHPDKPGTTAVGQDIISIPPGEYDGPPTESAPLLPFVTADNLPAQVHDIIAVIPSIGSWTQREFSNQLPGIGDCLFDVVVRSSPRGGESVHEAVQRASKWAIAARNLIQRAENWAPLPADTPDIQKVDYQMVKVTEIIHTRLEPMLARVDLFFRAMVERRPHDGG